MCLQTIRKSLPQSFVLTLGSYVLLVSASVAPNTTSAAHSTNRPRCRSISPYNSCRHTQNTPIRSTPELNLLLFVADLSYNIICKTCCTTNPQQLERLHQIHQIHCVAKNIPDIFDCNLKTNYQILIIFGTNISDTACHQMTIQFLTLPNVCFCTTWGKRNQRNITIYLMRCDCLINAMRKKHFVHISDTLADSSSSCPFFNCLQ